MPDMSVPPQKLSAFCWLARLFRYKPLTAETISNFWGVHWVHIRASEKYWNLPLCAIKWLLRSLPYFTSGKHNNVCYVQSEFSGS